MPAVYPKREAGPSVYFEHISSSILNPIKVHGYGYLVCSFMSIFFKLYRCFCHCLKIFMWFGYNPQIIFFSLLIVHIAKTI